MPLVFFAAHCHACGVASLPSPWDAACHSSRGIRWGQQASTMKRKTSETERHPPGHSKHLPQQTHAHSGPTCRLRAAAPPAPARRGVGRAAVGRQVRSPGPGPGTEAQPPGSGTSRRRPAAARPARARRGGRRATPWAPGRGGGGGGGGEGARGRRGRRERAEGRSGRLQCTLLRGPWLGVQRQPGARSSLASVAPVQRCRPLSLRSIAL